MGAMIDRIPIFVRENSPLFGVGAILLAAFAALVLFGGEPGSRDYPGEARQQGVNIVSARAHITALPASAEDTVVLTKLAPGDARARNAAVLFAAVGPGAARSFVFKGSAADRSRARECLALAALAEAGGGEADQRSVMQVILNRVRHPAFAKTVCGVVFEGSQRTTGCQFSFTCDGSLTRRYPAPLWEAARKRASEALGGRVDAAVGNATHFHADYVYPWWSPQLDKIAQVGPHLFFRWRGFWGTPQALAARYRGGEPDPLLLRGIAQSVERPADIMRTLVATGEAVRTISAPSRGDVPATATAAPASFAPGVHFVLVSAGDEPAALVEKARALCPGERYCQVYGWSDAGTVPTRLPLTRDARAALAFSFLAGRDANPEAVFFDCRIFGSAEGGACLPRPRN